MLSLPQNSSVIIPISEIPDGQIQDPGTLYSVSQSAPQAHPPLQARESPPDFHRFTELPLEIREMIWIFSLPARSIQVCPIMPKDGMTKNGMPKDGMPLLYDPDIPELLLEFSYKDENPSVLQTSRESREAALSVGGIINNWTYVCPGRDTLLFVGLEAVFQALLPTGERLESIMQLLMNTFNHEASRLTGQSAGSSTTIEWSAQFLRRGEGKVVKRSNVY